jgi:Fe-S-cluster-containing dehydrogenase component
MKNNMLHRFGMVIDLDKCTGCGSCMVACMAENNVPFRKDESNKLLSITWMRVFRLTNGKPFPKTDICYLPRPCMQCAGQHEGHSPCVSVCPATATDYGMSARFIPDVSDADIVWRRVRIIPDTLTGGIRSGRMVWKNT